MQSNQLSDAIWDRFETRRKRIRKAVGTGSAMAVIGIGVAMTAWPRPALAIQEVKQAMEDFNSVQWVQDEEGTIRDMGSDDPAVIPAFHQIVGHYASYQPADIQVSVIKSGNFFPNQTVKLNTWMGTTRTNMMGMVSIQDQPPVKRMTFSYTPAVGPSKNLGKWDIDQACNEMMSLKNFVSHVAPAESTQFQGKKAVRFHIREDGAKIVVDDVVIADPATKRMIYRRFEVTRPTGERLFLRELKDFRYDEPSPAAAVSSPRSGAGSLGGTR